MRLNKSTSHAIRILIECARAEGALVKVAELSARLDLTMQNVFKIVHVLSRAGLLEAARGRHGGVRLARPAASIRMSDIVRASEKTDIEVDASGRRSARSAMVDVNRVLDDALEAFVAVLDRHSLADMVGPPTRKPVRPRQPGRRSTQPARARAARPVEN
ncbi:MAG: Rrf2 family transcriptional regulator [Hyphomicrobiaceae bacterium]